MMQLRRRFSKGDAKLYAFDSYSNFCKFIFNKIKNIFIATV
jgi:hypothetical protein